MVESKAEDRPYQTKGLSSLGPKGYPPPN